MEKDVGVDDDVSMCASESVAGPYKVSIALLHNINKWIPTSYSLQSLTILIKLESDAIDDNPSLI